MNVFIAIIVTLGLLVLGVIFPPLFLLIFIGTLIWASIDAGSINISKYELNGPNSLGTVILGFILLWLVYFPWYLINRGIVTSGKAVLRPEYQKKAFTESREQLRKENLGQLERLGELKAKGVITEEEFQAQKNRLLA